MDPTREETYQFIARFLGEMATIFPDPYMHIGGDETPAPDWKTNPRILGVYEGAPSQGLRRASGLLQHAGAEDPHAVFTSTWSGWDEILNPALPKDVDHPVLARRSSLAKGAQEGYQGILSAPYYLDGMKSAGVHYLADPLPSNSPLTPEQTETHSWRRSLHVGRAARRAHHRLSHLAKNGCDRRTFLVSGERSPI